MSAIADAVQIRELRDRHGAARREMDDLNLISKAQAGDHDAFEELYVRHSPQLIRCIRRIIQNPSDAEDILQETLLSAFTHLKNFEGRSSVSTWMTRIAINAALSNLRKRRRGVLSLDHAGDDSGPDQVLSLPDQSPDPEWQLLQAEREQVLQHRLLRLPPRLRDIVELRIKLGYSGKQIAKKLAISESAAKSRLNRAQLRLCSFEAIAACHRPGL